MYQMSIPSGITTQGIHDALRSLDSGIEHSFGESTQYDLVYEGKGQGARTRTRTCASLGSTS
jgi:hypothetical protein